MVVEAIKSGEMSQLREELGDLLYRWCFTLPWLSGPGILTWLR